MLKIAAVTMVKDEADIIEVTLRNMLTIAANIIVADNLSTDGTPEILRGLEREFPSRLHVEIDSEPAYYQARKMSDMIRKAAEWYSPDWIIPFDADEMWIVDKDELSGIPHAVDAVEATVQQYMLGERVDCQSLPKVIVRGNGLVRVTQGNHAARRDDGPVRVGLSSAIVKHSPYRSEEQFIRKIRNGSAAYAAGKDIPEQYGRHWKFYGTMTDDELRKAWASL